jgi:hypothetical protein
MTLEDLHLITVILEAGILMRVVTYLLRLILLKAFLEPLAYWSGRKGYKRLNELLGGVLPGLKG